jgi:predicted nucleotidyltransferase
MAEDASAVRHIIRKYVHALTEIGVRVQQVFLYGSHAKNTAHEDSDIDVIIVSEDFAGKNLLERLQILAKANHHILEPVEAYGFTPEEIQNRDLAAFWEEILETEAISITDEILVPA